MFPVNGNNDQCFRTLWPDGEHPVRKLSAENNTVTRAKLDRGVRERDIDCSLDDKDHLLPGMLSSLVARRLFERWMIHESLE